MYGMGAKLMSSMLDVSLEECLKILEEFYNMFPTVKEYTQRNEESARQKGYVEDYMGRRRHLPDIQLPQVRITANKYFTPNLDMFDENFSSITATPEDVEKGLMQKKHEFLLPDGTLPIFDAELTKEWEDKYNELMGQKYNYNVKAKFKEDAGKNGIDVFDNGAFISKATTQCTNATIQGSAATLTKKAMISIFRNKRLNELGFRLMIPVHDELLGECPKENAEEVEKLLSQCMIDAAKPECSVNMKVDTYVVKHWYSDEVANAIEDTFKQLVNGNPKKNLQPIPEADAIKKLCDKYPEIHTETVIKMCKGEFDQINGTL